MDTPVNVEELRRSIRQDVQRRFAELVKSVKSSSGSLTAVAAQLGVKRQMLDQYASGSVPASDVLLAAFLKWGWTVRTENRGVTPAWCEFSVSDMEGGVRKRKREPVQLSLFDALTDLDQNLDTLKKNVGRVEFELERAFGKRA